MIRSAKPAGFIAGADIKEFQDFDAKGTVKDAIRRGQQVFQRLAELPCPTVAAIHGFCMGGGTELALACRYRVASQRSVHPHRPAGSEARHLSRLGRQRAPAAAGRRAGGDGHDADRPHAVGIGGARRSAWSTRWSSAAMLVDAAVELALNAARSARSSSASLAWATNTWPARQLLAPMLVKQVARKARKEHYPAPYALIDTWRRSGGGIQSRLAAERKSVVEARRDADRAQPDPRVLPAGAAEGPGRQGPRHPARARGRRRRDGRRHRGVVGLQGLRGHAAATASSASSTAR